MVSETLFELLFPKQELKVGAHSSGTGDSFTVIIDWLGSLEGKRSANYVVDGTGILSMGLS